MTHRNGSNGGRDPARERIGFATIDLVGRNGLAATDVEALCERARVNRSHFDRCFADLEDCFLSLHDEVADAFWAQVTASYEGAGNWHDRIWAAGWAAMRFLQDDPVRARFLLVAVNGCGSGAQARRDRFLQQLADLLDRGRPAPEKAQRVSRATAEIAAGAIYGMLIAKVQDGAIERGEEFLPELVYLATMPYLGARAAEDELLVQPLR